MPSYDPRAPALHWAQWTPDPTVWDFLRPFVEEYDAAVFTMKQFVPSDLTVSRLAIVPPAIDPLSSRNMDADGRLPARGRRSSH
jgi:hypothetical protein